MKAWQLGLRGVLVNVFWLVLLTGSLTPTQVTTEVPYAPNGQVAGLSASFDAVSAAEVSIRPEPQALGWTIECADCPKSFSDMTDRSLQVDANGYPHLAYGADHLYYAWHGSAWHYEAADDAPGVGGHASLALDSSSYPHISYCDGTNEDLKDLCESFREGKWAVEVTGLRQEPWLDDDGDGVPNEAEDCGLAQRRGLVSLTVDRPPVIDIITVPMRIEGYEGTIKAKVRDDENVDEVWAVIYPPSFEEPDRTETMPELELTSIKLWDLDGDGEYSGTYGEFTEIGEYHIVVYAEDDEGDQAAPQGADVNRGWKVYLPLVMGYQASYIGASKVNRAMAGPLEPGMQKLPLHALDFACGYDHRIDVYPSPIIAGDIITITPSGIWPNSCVPEYRSHQVVGNAIRIEAVDTSESQICLQALTPWALSVAITPSLAGVHTAQFYIARAGSFPFLCDSTSFTVIPASTSAVISTDGGELTHRYPGHVTSLTVPPGALSAPSVFTISYHPPLTTTGLLQGMDHFFDLASTQSVFAIPLTITIHYSESARGAIIAGTDNLYRWQNGQWVTDGITLTGRWSNGLAVQVTRLSLFGVLGRTKGIYLPIVLR